MAKRSSTYSDMLVRRSGASDCWYSLTSASVSLAMTLLERGSMKMVPPDAMRMKMPVRVLWSLEVLTLRRVPA